jgi:hypothetical protein
LANATWLGSGSSLIKYANRLLLIYFFFPWHTDRHFISRRNV